MNWKLLIPFVSLLAVLSGASAFAEPVERSVSAKISYGVGKTDVNPDYRGNKKAVSTLDSVFGSDAPVSRIEVLSYSSPEGPFAVNKRLVGERASLAVDFLKHRYSLPDSVFVRKTVDEDWQGVSAYLLRSDKPWKEEALQIIRAAGKNRKVQLQELWVGEAWDDLVKNAFPSLRRTEIRVVLEVEPQDKDLVLFRRGYRQLDLTEGNLSALDAVKSRIDDGYSGAINIIGYYSPDGSEAANEKLSLARARNVRDYIANVLHYQSDKISISSGGVDWDKFVATVENSYYGDDKASVLEILKDQSLSSAQKKRALLALGGGNTWYALKGDQMLALCAVKIVLDDDHMRPEHNNETPEQLEKPDNVEDTELPEVSGASDEPPETTVIVEETDKPVSQEYNIGEEVPVEETVPNEEQVPAEYSVPVDVKVASRSQTVSFGLGTNLLFDALTGINASLSIPVGKHWEVTADCVMPWWKNRDKNFAFQLAHLDVGARYYFKPWVHRNDEVLRGWFASASAGAGYYDFALWNPNGVQGEEFKLSFGGGYSLAIGPWWRLTTELGFGPVFSQYRIYNAEATDLLVVKEEASNVFFRPTTAKISLTYLLHTPSKVR